MSNGNTRTTKQKLAIFGRFFTGLRDVYGTYDPTTGRARQIKGPVTDQVFLAHLLGRRPYGVYLLVEDHTSAVVADFDDDDLGPPMEFVKAAGHYRIPAHIEPSKSKGYHAWIFFDEAGVPAAKARLVVKHILDEIGRPDTEVFPKQDRLNGSASYGNFINAPLFGALVPKGRTVFVDPVDPRKPFPNQWDFLESIQPVPEAALDEIIEVNQLARPAADQNGQAAERPAGTVPSFGLPPCARRMLDKGVSSYQRVACFRLAVQLRKSGMPHDATVATLMTWAQKNKPERGMRVITEEEIAAQIRGAYKGCYTGCGCDDPAVRPYCDPKCGIFQKRHPTARSENRSVQNGSTRREAEVVPESAEKEAQNS